MSDNAIELPGPQVLTIEVGDEGQADGPVYAVVVNGEEGLQTKVIDVRAEAPHAFAPRTVGVRLEPRALT